jgi:hypothetical protein
MFNLVWCLVTFFLSLVTKLIVMICLHFQAQTFF